MDNEKTVNQPEGSVNESDCGCDDGCCQPKKSNRVRKTIFAVIVLAALAIVTVKLVSRPVVTPGKEAACKPGSSRCDTSKATTCDTTKGSSCCPKSK